MLARNALRPATTARLPSMPLKLERDHAREVVDDLDDAEVEAVLARLVREREAIERWTAAQDAPPAVDAWALANAREAIREEPW
jgi:hypothetical protein